MTDKRILDELASRFHVDLGKHRQAINCPLHHETDPSCTIWLSPPGDEHFKCFGCGESGSILWLLAKSDGKTIKQKLREFGIERDPRKDALDFLVDTFAGDLESGETYLVNGGKQIASEFLTQVRGHDLKTLKLMRVGVATADNIEMIQQFTSEDALSSLKLIVGRKEKVFKIPVGAIVFPVTIAGEVVGLRWKRYSTHNLVKKEIDQMSREGWLRFVQVYNFDAINYDCERLFIVEGEDDVLRVLGAGGIAIGFPGGVSARDSRLKLLTRTAAKKLVIATDNDPNGAGEKYRDNIIKFLRKEGKEGWVYIPEGKDISIDLDKISLEEIVARCEEATTEFRESQGAYWNGGIKLSTFVFDIKAKIISEEEVLLVLEVRGEKEPESKIIVVENKLVADKYEFNKFIKTKGCYSWKASPGDLDDLVTDKWDSKLPVFHAVPYIGRVNVDEYFPELNLRAFVTPDRMFLPGNNEKRAENGILHLDEQRGLYPQMPPKAQFSSEDIVPSMDRFKDLLEAMWRPEHKIVLGWFLAVPWLEEIRDALGGFPILWISGQQGSGKTTFVSFLLGLYYPVKGLKDDKMDSYMGTGRTSPEGFSTALARYSCMPVLLDDVRMNARYALEYMEIMRVLYDRFSTQKGRLRLKGSLVQAYESRKMRAALAVTSQHPPEDEALYQRTLEIVLKKSYITDKKDAVYGLRALARELYSIGLHFTIKSLNESIKEELNIAMQMLGDEAISSRKLQAFAVAAAGLLKAGIPQQEVVKTITNLNVSEESMAAEMDEIEEFFDYVRTAASSKPMEVQRYIGCKEEGYWITPGHLYDITSVWHRDKRAFSKRSVKRLLQAQPGVKSFKTDKGVLKEKVIRIKAGEGWTSVRAIFFDFGSDMAKRLKGLFVDDYTLNNYEDPIDESQVVDEGQETGDQVPPENDEPFADQF